jgi:hypothetical protein
MIRTVTVFIFLTLIVSCGNKKKKNGSEDSRFYPVASFLKKQVASVDSSMFRITRIVTRDTISDTAIISRDEFHKLANDFLSLPDITDPDNKDYYEESNGFEQTLDNALLTYTTNEPGQKVRRETVMLAQDPTGNYNQVKTILINLIDEKKNGSVEKDLTWHVGQRFQVVTKTNLDNQQEKIETLQVIWSDFTSQEK